MLIITYISNVTLACDDGDPTKAHKAMTDFLILNLTDFTDDTHACDDGKRKKAREYNVVGGVKEPIHGQSVETRA